MPTSKSSTSSDSWTLARRQLIADCIEKDDYKRLLLELLAVIHRDGGHYTELVGLQTSVEQAEHLIPETYRRLAALQARLGQLSK